MSVGHSESHHTFAQPLGIEYVKTMTGLGSLGPLILH